MNTLDTVSKIENLVSGPGVEETFQTFGIFVVRAILDIGINSPESRNVSINNGKCGVLSFNGEGDSEQAMVTRQSESTWLVNADLGYCRNEGSLWHMPLSATITRQ